jgi:hypothetical protein
MSNTITGPRITEMDALIADGNIDAAEKLTNTVIEELDAFLKANDAQPEGETQLAGAMTAYGADERLPFLLFGFTSTGGASFASALDPSFNDSLRIVAQTLYRLGFIAGRQAERTENAA